MKIVNRVTTMGTSMFSWKRGYMDTKTEPEDINFFSLQNKSEGMVEKRDSKKYV